MLDEKYYDKYWMKNIDAKSSHLPPTWTKENLQWHLSFFGKYIGESVLDVGAGDGTFLNFLFGNNNKIKKSFASELSDVAVRIGKEKHPNIVFRKESLENLGFKSDSFDTVFAIEVIEHLLDVDTCLFQINRVLKKGGYFCVTTTDFNWLKKIIIASFYWDKFFYPNNPHIRFFTKKTLNEMCKKYSLELVDYKWNKSYFGLMPKGQMIVFKKTDTIESSKKHFEVSYSSRTFLPPQDIRFSIYSTKIWNKFLSLSRLDDKVVDFGCGGGTVLYCLEKNGFKNLFGIDFCNTIPDGFLKYSKFVKANVLSTGFENGFFNSVISTMVIEHLDEEKFKNEVSRVLKVGGLALITSVMKKKRAWYFYKNNKGERVIEPTHIKEYLSVDEFRGIFENDFEVIEAQSPILRYPIIDPIFRGLFSLFKIQALRELPTRNYFLSKLRNIRIPILGYYSIEIILRKKIK